MTFTATGPSTTPLSKQEPAAASNTAPAPNLAAQDPRHVLADPVPAAEVAIPRSTASAETVPLGTQPATERIKPKQHHVEGLMSSNWAARHREMAGLYQRLAQLHREEAEESEALRGAAYPDEVEDAGG